MWLVLPWVVTTCVLMKVEDHTQLSNKIEHLVIS